MRNEPWRLLPVGTAAMLAAAVAVSAAQAPATLSIEPAIPVIEPGEVMEFSLAVQGAREAFAVDVELRFDPAAAEVVDADPAAPGVQVEPGPFLVPDFVVENAADNASGTIRLAFTQLAPRPAASGDGVLATIGLRGRAGGPHALQVTGIVLARDDGRPQTVLVAGSPASPPGTPTPTVTATPRLPDLVSPTAVFAASPPQERTDSPTSRPSATATAGALLPGESPPPPGESALWPWLLGAAGVALAAGAAAGLAIRRRRR